MSDAQLQTALDNLDTEIVTLSAKAADAVSYSVPQLTVMRQRLKELVETRKLLKEQVVASGSNVYEVHSRWVPT